MDEHEHTVDTARIKELLDRADANVESRLRVQRAADRSVLGLLIVGTFVLTIVGLFAFVILCPPGAWEKQAEFLSRVLSSVLLPVVTLVLGYYFGTEKAKA